MAIGIFSFCIAVACGIVTIICSLFPQAPQKARSVDYTEIYKNINPKEL